MTATEGFMKAQIEHLEEENKKLKSDLEQFSESYKKYRDYEKEELAESCYDLARENKKLKDEKEKIDELISNGELSDGYHTFNSLYHQRAILFATIVNMNRDKSWKSKKHSDGKYCFDKEGEWFIVGIDTPKGSYTYHYETDKYWDLFKCEELELGKERDGHTEKDVDRLLSLGDVVGNLKHRIRQLSDECERLQYLYDKIERVERERDEYKERWERSFSA